MDSEQFLRDCVTLATLALTLTKLLIEIWKAAIDAWRQYYLGETEYKRKLELSRLPKNGRHQDDPPYCDP